MRNFTIRRHVRIRNMSHQAWMIKIKLIAPYLLVTCDGRTLWKTEVVRKTNTPEWQPFVIDLPQIDSNIET